MRKIHHTVTRQATRNTIVIPRLIATLTSAENDCAYCQTIHGAIAAHHLGGDEALVQQVKADRQHAPISDKLKALLTIAAHTARSGRDVTTADIAAARAAGATDLEIHDTVLIAAVFCLCNRYVDGLATWMPDDPDFYRIQHDADAARTRFEQSPAWPASGASGERR